MLQVNVNEAWERRGDDGEMKDRDSEGSEVQRGGMRRMSGLRAKCETAESLSEHCNRIYYDIAIIQLSPYWFKLMLLGVQ